MSASLPDIATPEWVDAYLLEGDPQDHIANLWRRFVAEVCSVRLTRRGCTRDVSMDIENLSAILTFAVLTDDPDALSIEINRWVVWLISRDVLASDPHRRWDARTFQDSVARHLDARGYATKDLARRLLEDGFPPASIASPEARDYLGSVGFAPGFVREFLLPPPALARAGAFLHPHVESFPESPLLFPPHVETTALG